MDIVNNKRIILLCGEYGSGKTEFALHYALELAKNKVPVYIADLDVINVYFRAREQFSLFEKYGITLLGNDLGNNVSLDVPYISSNIYAPLSEPESYCIYDLAGGTAGIKVLSLINSKLKDDYEFWFVANIFRENTDSVLKIESYIKSIEEQSGLKVTGIINNTNLINETSAEDYMEGYKLILEVSMKMNIPLKYNFINRNVFNRLDEELIGEMFIFDSLLMREFWQ